MSLKQETTLTTTLGPRVEDRQRLVAERNRLDEEIRIVSDDIARELALADQKSIRVGRFLVTLVENPGRLTLDKRRLLELGVSAELMTAASTRGQPSVTLHVRQAAEDSVE